MCITGASIPAVCCGTAAPKPVTSDQSKQETPKGDAEGQEPPPDGPSPASHEKEGSFHPGVSCDGCNGPIYGTRFKCLVCRDYDLCSSCEGKGIHVDHNMISISDPWSYHPWGGFGWHTHAGFGPFHGRRGGCCRGRRFGDHHHGHHGDDHHGHGDGDRDHHDRRHHFGDHGFVPPWCFGFGKGGASCHGSEHKERSHGEGQEPMETEHRPGPSEEERKSFLRGVGEAVSNFLEPFGVKVDVDVVGGEKSADTKTTGDANVRPSTFSVVQSHYFPTISTLQDVAEVSDEVVEEALAQLRSMGYQDEGGWLKELVRAKKGDVTKVLDALHPTVEQD